MSNKQYELVDTDGDNWLVLPGDPAHTLCDAVHKLGWEPLFPVRVLIRGRVTPEDVAEALADLQDIIEATTEDNLILHVHRTYAQLRYLEEQ